MFPTTSGSQKLITFRKCLLVLATALLVAGCAGDRAYRDGVALIDRGQVEDGLVKVEEATKLAPDNAQYRIALMNYRISVANRWLLAADGELAASKFSEAETSYSRVLKMDKENPRAKAGLDLVAQARKHTALIAAARANFNAGDLDTAEGKVRLVLLENPNQREAKTLAGKIEEVRAKSKFAAPALRPYKSPISLEFRDAGIKSVFGVLSDTIGINFILDKDLPPEQRVSIFVKQVTLERALSLLLKTNNLSMKIIDDNTVLVYSNTPQKIQEYENLMVKNFYLANAAPKDVVNLLRTILKIKDIHVDERLNLLVVRAAPDTLQLAEKLIAAQDLPEPEVLLEVTVVEIKRSRFLDLGIQYPSQFGVINAPTITTSEAGVVTTMSPGIPTVNALRNVTLGGLSVSPLPTVNILSGIVNSNLLANPSIRVRNREKAKIHIGEKVPVVTSAPAPASGIPPPDTVTYEKVGIILDVEPTIYLDGDVAIRISLDVSSIVDKIKTANGSEVYRLSTRNASTMLRLKDGETQLLAGLISNEDRSTISGLPGLAELPLIGRLFSNQSDDRQKTEIVLSITPHIVRNIVRPSADVLQFWSGTESNVGFGGEMPSSPVMPGDIPAIPEPQPDNLAPPDMPGMMRSPDAL